MNNEEVQRILASDDFKALNRQRNGVRWGLAVVVLLCHAFFVGGIAFYNQWFGQMSSEGSSIPLGIIFTVLVIILMLACEGVYIWFSHKKFDPLQNQVISRVSNNEK